MAVEGFVLLALAVPRSRTSTPTGGRWASTTAAFFAAYGALLLVAGWGLWRRAGWSRGPALITQLIWLGLAWNIREHVGAAIALAVVALVVLAGVLHPASIEALTGEAPRAAGAVGQSSFSSDSGAGRACG